MASSVYAIETVFPSGDMLNIELTKSIRELPIQKEIILDSEFRNRLDLLSYRHYNTTDLWWLIGIYNNIQDVTNMSDSIVRIQLPSLADITTLLSDFLRNAQ